MPGAPPRSSSAHWSVANATPSVATASGVVGARLERRAQAGRDVRPAQLGHALDLLDVAGIGMTPGMIGTSMPIAARALDEVEVDGVVEEQLGDEELRARVDLVLEVAQVVLGRGRVDVRLGEARAADREVVVVAR